MKISEKKLGIIKETIRYNFQSSKIVGGIEVTDDKNQRSRNKFVSIGNENNLIFWISNDFEISVSSNDVIGCKVVDSGKLSVNFFNNGCWYGPVLELKLVDGSKVRLVINEFLVEQGVYRDASVADIPHVEGWLAPDGTRDEHYKDAFCPQGYTPNIVGYSKTKFGVKGFKRIDNILKLTERFPENFDTEGKPKGIYIFDGKKNTYYIKKQ